MHKKYKFDSIFFVTLIIKSIILRGFMYRILLLPLLSFSIQSMDTNNLFQLSEFDRKDSYSNLQEVSPGYEQKSVSLFMNGCKKRPRAQAYIPMNDYTYQEGGDFFYSAQHSNNISLPVYVSQGGSKHLRRLQASTARGSFKKSTFEDDNNNIQNN